MLLSTSIAITAVFLTGCEASIKGLSSPNIGILPNGQIKSFKNFPLGGLLCDNAAKTTFLFEDYQVKDSISKVLGGLLAGDDASYHFKKGTPCGNVKQPYYSAPLGDLHREEYYVEYIWNQASGEITLCGAASVKPPIVHGKTKSCVGLPERKPLSIVKKPLDLPTKMVCPRGPSKIKPAIEADHTDITNGIAMSVYKVLGKAQEKYPTGPCKSPLPLFRAPMLSGAILMDFTYDKKTGQATYCSAVAADAPEPESPQNRCKEYKIL